MVGAPEGDPPPDPGRSRGRGVQFGSRRTRVQSEDDGAGENFDTRRTSVQSDKNGAVSETFGSRRTRVQSEDGGASENFDTRRTSVQADDNNGGSSTSNYGPPGPSRTGRGRGRGYGPIRLPSAQTGAPRSTPQPVDFRRRQASAAVTTPSSSSTRGLPKFIPSGKRAAEAEVPLVDAPPVKKPAWTPQNPNTVASAPRDGKFVFSWAEEVEDAEMRDLPAGPSSIAGPFGTASSSKTGNPSSSNVPSFKGKRFNAQSQKDVDRNHANSLRNQARDSAVAANDDQKYRDLVLAWFDLNAPRGTDSPTGKMKHEWNKSKITMIVTKSMKGEDGKCKWSSRLDYKTKFGLDTQHPHIEIAQEKSGGTFLIYPHHIAPFECLVEGPDPDAMQNFALLNLEIKKNELTPEKVVKDFGEVLFMSGMDKDLAQQIVDYCAEQGPEPGLVIYSFHLYDTRGEFSATPELSQYLGEHRGMGAIIRNKVKAEPELQKFFDYIMTQAVVFGTCWHFNIPLSKKQEWVRRARLPDYTFTHQPWMRIPESQKSSGAQYASHDLYKQYPYRKMYRDVQSAGLVFEMQAQIEILQQFCGGHAVHDATVLRIGEDGMVELDVALNLPDDATIPSLKDATKMTVRILPDAAPTQPKAPAEEDTAMSDAQTATDAAQTVTEAAQPVPQFEAYVDESRKYLRGDFKLTFDNSEEKVKLLVDSKVKISLNMEETKTTVIRQLEAVRDISSLLLPGDEGYDIQQIIFGTAGEYTEEHPIWVDDISPDNSKLVELYMKSATMNDLQVSMVKSVIANADPITIGLGPPGTGKSTTIARTVAIATICGKHSLACAPTNTATLQIHGHLKAELAKMSALPGAGRIKYKLVFFPKMPTTQEELTRNVGFVDEASLSVHFIQLMLADVNNADYSQTKRDEASRFLGFYHNYQSGVAVAEEDASWFMGKFKKYWHRVLDECKYPVIVVSTCNNAHSLKAVKIWTPQFVVIDEAAFSLEPDNLIPLTLKKKQGDKKGKRPLQDYNLEKVLFVGDDFQLNPVVVSRFRNEYVKTLQTSLFSRMTLNGRPVTALNVNYRMPWRIAMFPGMIQYGWLGCAENTEVESQAYLGAKRLYAEFEMCGFSLSQLRRPSWYDKPEGDCRRLLFNTRSSRSAPAEGRNSIRNFGNINAIVSVVRALTRYVDPDLITILSPYKEQKLELGEQLKHRVKQQPFHLDTVDSIQGGENEIILLDLTPANEHHGSQLGFLREWSRMNVALTRAKSVLWIFGNIDLWESEIQILNASTVTRNWAFFIIDLLSFGDVVDIFGDETWGDLPVCNNLPEITEDGQYNRDANTWSRNVAHTKNDPSLWDDRRDLTAVFRSIDSNTNTLSKELIWRELKTKYRQWQVREDQFQEEERLRKQKEAEEREAE